MKNEINHTESNPRSFYVDTPLGKLRIYSKMLGIDIPENFPGVYVDYISPISKEPISLSCTEYDPSKNVIQTIPYEMAWCDDPSGVFVHQDLNYLDQDYVEQMIHNFAAKNGMESYANEDSGYNHVAVRNGVEVFPGVQVEVMVNLEKFTVCRYLVNPTQAFGPNFEIRRYPSLSELYKDVLDLLAQPETFALSEQEWQSFAKDRSGLNWLRFVFLHDTKIVLDHMEDPQCIEPGTVGVVTYVDDIGTIHVRWPSGSSLGLIFGVDRFHLVESSESEVDEPAFDPEKLLNEITSPEVCAQNSFKLQRVVADSVNVDVAMLLNALKNNNAEEVLLALTEKSAKALFQKAGITTMSES